MDFTVSFKGGLHMIRKIAISGMKGRKKDTFLLSFVVLLSFLFIVTATILYSSSEKTKNIQRTNTFGSWHGSYLNADEEVGESILKIKEVEELGKSRIIGKSKTLGSLGTFNQELLDMGHFQLHEGRFPEKDNEIALELNQLSYLSQDIKVGDTIPVEVVIPLYQLDMESVVEAQMKKLEPELREIEDELKRLAEVEGESTNFYVKEDFSTDLGRIKWIRDKMEIDEEEETPLIILYNLWGNRIVRNEQTLEVFDGVKVVTKTSYLYATIAFEDEKIEDNIEEVRKNGTIISEDAFVTKDMIVTGIVQTYSNLWDIDKFPVANSFITEEAGRSFLEGGFYLSEEMDLSEHKFPNNYFIKSSISAGEFYERYNGDLSNFRRNSFAYPETAGSTETTLTYGILGFIFIATIFSVFQIYLTQMKRRIRKIALLKSIGATNSQVRGILIWELIYLLIFCIPISILGGILTVKLILYSMNNIGNTELNFYINYKLLILGMIAGIISVIIGMTLPMIKSMKVPLTGTISKAPKHKRTSKIKRSRLKTNNFNMEIQTFRKISIKNLRYNKSNILFTLSLYTITISVLIGAIFLSFLAFEDYIDQVIATDKPDYGFEFDFGIRHKEIPDYVEAFESIEGVKNVELYKGGQHAYMWYEGIENNEVQSTFRKILPANLVDQHFGENSGDFANLDDDIKYLVEEAIVTNTYTIDSEGELFNKFENAIDLGVVDKKKFEKGEQVIVLMPMYSPIDFKDEELNPVEDKSIIENTEQKSRSKDLLGYSGLYDLSYDFRNSQYYLRDNTLSPGHKINLTIPTEAVSEGNKTNEVAFHELEVGAIIYYFPEEGIWPFSESVENPVVIGSYNLITDLYPATLTGKGNLSLEELRNLIARLMPTRYGKTWIYLELDNKADDIQVQVDLQRLAIEKESRLYNYIESNNIVFGKAFKVASIIIILGLSVSFIALIILYNTSISKLEQERERIGSLQAIGVTGQQFKKLYLVTGIAYGLISLILAHIFMAIIVLITSVGNSGPILINIKNKLWLYPWKVHIIVCSIYFIITVLTYYLPLGKILKNQPVNNIRSLNS